MSDKSAIEWTDATWNPVTGCTKVSPGCAHCYAETITLRFKRGGPFLPGKTTIRLHPGRLADPGSWRAPRRVFVNSMSDLFHEEVPFEYVRKVFQKMETYNAHIYQVLTKRPERMLEFAERGMDQSTWPDHVWAGTSVENQYWADRRIPILQKVPARVRFLSVEPLLKAVDLRPYLSSLQWVIVGGESGHRARPMKEEWALRIRDDCERRRPFRSFSSSGAGEPVRPTGGYSRIVPGTRCRIVLVNPFSHKVSLRWFKTRNWRATGCQRSAKVRGVGTNYTSSPASPRCSARA